MFMTRLMIAGVVLVAGSGGSAAPSESPSAAATGPPPAPQVTLTDDGCSADSVGAIPGGMTGITVHNDSSTGPANFELVRLVGTFEEAAQFMADVRAGVEPPPGELPFIAEEADRTLVDRGETGELEADLAAATYAVVCVALDENDDIITAYVVGPFTGGE
jgi:hypothetical protein